jgi:hypothetical protein
MTPLRFAIAYRQHLERRSRAEIEPPEPIPDDYGMPPIRDDEGRRVCENPLAEKLRVAVKQDFDRDVMERVKGREYLTPK